MKRGGTHDKAAECREGGGEGDVGNYRIGGRAMMPPKEMFYPKGVGRCLVPNSG